MKSPTGIRDDGSEFQVRPRAIDFSVRVRRAGSKNVKCSLKKLSFEKKVEFWRIDFGKFSDFPRKIYDSPGQFHMNPPPKNLTD